MSAGPSLKDPTGPAWAALREETARQERERALSLTPDERVELGVTLSRVAAEVVDSVARAGHAPWLSTRP